MTNYLSRWCSTLLLVQMSVSKIKNKPPAMFWKQAYFAFFKCLLFVRQIGQCGQVYYNHFYECKILLLLFIWEYFYTSIRFVMIYSPGDYFPSRILDLTLINVGHLCRHLFAVYDSHIFYFIFFSFKCFISW